MFRLYFLLPLLIPLALARGDFLGRIFHPVERWVGRLALKPARAIALVGVASMVMSAGLTLCGGIPVPQTHDEFGYLLLGDTFAHGRATNPTPPLWEHFETIHQIERPTYAAKYPPGQGVALAVGEWLGQPIIGVWLAMAVACGALCWAFMAWLPPRWALVGGLMVALHPQILEWTQNYWGGSVATLGGALLLGAFGRMLRQFCVRDAVWMGIGLGLMANSRPYEGAVVGLMVLVTLLIWLIKKRNVPLGIVVRRIAIPLLAVLLLFGAQIGYYDWRVTGNPLVMPYMVHERTYALAPQFLIGKPWPEPNYRFREIRELHEAYMQYYQGQVRSVRALADALGLKIWTLAQAFLWSYLMVVALLGLPVALSRERELWFVLFMAFFFLMSVLVGTWVFPHYAAPAVGLFFLLVLKSMRCVNAWHSGTRRWGRNIVRGLAILFLISYFHVAAKISDQDKTRWYFQRQALLDSLRRQPEKSLVIVKYDPTHHNPNREWVYNEADLEHAKVILARDMGPQNQELLDYYRDRKAWVVHADAEKPELERYPGS